MLRRWRFDFARYSFGGAPPPGRAQKNSTVALDNDISFATYLPYDISLNQICRLLTRFRCPSLRLPSTAPAIPPLRATAPVPGAIAATGLARRCRSSFSPSPALSGSRRRLASPRSACGLGAPRSTTAAPAAAVPATIGANSPSARVRIATGRAARPAIPFSTSAGAKRCARSRRRPRPTPISSAGSASRATARRSTVSWPIAKRPRPPTATSPRRPTRCDRAPPSAAPRFLLRGAARYRAGDAPKPGDLPLTE